MILFTLRRLQKKQEGPGEAGATKKERRKAAREKKQAEQVEAARRMNDFALEQYKRDVQTVMMGHDGPSLQRKLLVLRRMYPDEDRRMRSEGMEWRGSVGEV